MRLAVLALIVVSLAQAPAAPAGTIRGRVVDAETGRPIPRAVVRVTRMDGRGDEVSTTTDERGTFVFDDLPAGRYDGFVTAARHAMRPITTGSNTVTVTPGRPIDVAVSLPRTYAINVRVVDVFGDPLSRMNVVARSADTGRRSGAGPQYSTDDLGRLRIFDLEPGRYILCAAGGPIMASVEAPASTRHDRLLHTCFPSSDDTAAEPVRVVASDVDGIEIRMRRGRTFSVTGSVVDSAGAPAGSAHVTFSRYQPSGSFGMGVSVDADGRFGLFNIAPGSYAIEAAIDGVDQGDRRHADEAGFVAIQIGDEDLDGMIVRLAKTVDVQGRVTLDDPAATLPRPPGSGLIISAKLDGVTFAGMGGAVTTIMRSDRTLTLSGLFGRRALKVMNVPRGWYLKAIRYGTRDLVDEPIEFTARANAPTLEIVLSNRGAVVTGTVTADPPATASRAMVYLLRTDARGVSLAALARVSSRSSFTIGPLRGGDYTVVALPESAPPVDESQRDRLARLAALGERITLTDVDERSVPLRLAQER